MSHSNHSKTPNGVPTSRYSKVIAHNDAQIGSPKAKRTTKMLRRRAERRQNKSIRTDD